MQWSFQLCRLFGIAVRVHLTFFLLLLFVGISEFVRTGVPYAIRGMLFICALFCCVVAHELGHSLVARAYGVNVRQIMLLPIGGVAQMDRIPDIPRQEFFISIAGPAVSLVLGAVFLGVALLLSGAEALLNLGTMGGHFLAQLGVVNFALAIFNLIPAFPMDGGRVLRAILGEHMDYAQATRIAAVIGQGIAIMLAFVGLLFNPWLILIAVFIFLGAGQEEHMVQLRTALRGITVSQVMMTNIEVVSPEEPLGAVLARATRGPQHDFPVVHNGQLVGMITRDDMFNGLHEYGMGVPVAHVMRTDFPRIDAYLPLSDAYTVLMEAGLSSAPVTYAGQLVGLITRDSVATAFMLSAASRRRLYGG